MTAYVVSVSVRICIFKRDNLAVLLLASGFMIHPIRLPMYHYQTAVWIEKFTELDAPPLHLTTSKVMVIVWRLSELFYIGNVLPLQWAQLTETVHTALLGHEFAFVFFWVA